MQYVTIDRGNRFRGSNRESANERNRNTNKADIDTNNLLRSEEEEETVVTDAPQAATSTGRSLE